MRIDKLRESPHWSYSAMQCYLTCPLKYKFRDIDNAESERTGSCFPFGRAFHRFAEQPRQKFRCRIECRYQRYCMQQSGFRRNYRHQAASYLTDRIDRTGGRSDE